jgi:MoaA/NifB/PqqE/SkfB family radical SAM enzyme
MKYKVIETPVSKHLRSEEYNFDFDKKSGFFARWGKDKDDDPQVGLPEIADIEITTKCSGPAGKLCKFCYKANTPKGDNMTIETFEKILDKLPKTVTQIAFGADANCTSNPDIWKIMEATRARGIVPNITVADISDEVADKLASLCGAVAVSRYDNENLCYDTVKKLTDRGMTQVNIHQMISKETYEQAMQTIADYKSDPRLEKLNAIVFLSLKTKGRGKKGFGQLSHEEFAELTNICLESNTPFGFDSCGAHKFLKSIEGFEDKRRKALEISAEPCESSLFSTYIDTFGLFHPCSFSPDTETWGSEGLDVVNCNNFIEDIWNHERTKEFRKTLLAGRRNCPLYRI